jgi:hypothetical protein
MLKRILLVLIAVSFLPVFPQAMVEDGKVTITPNWEPGDTKTYIRKAYSFIKEDGEYLEDRELDSSKSEWVFTVLEKGDTTYTIETKQHFLDENDGTGIDSAMYEAMNGVRYVHLINDKGNFKEITNKAAIKNLRLNTYYDNWQYFGVRHPQTGREIKNRVQAQNLMKQRYQQLDPVIWMIWQMDRPFILYYAAYNESLNMKGETIKKDTIKHPELNPNPVIETKYTMSEMDAVNNTASFTAEATYSEKDPIGTYFAYPLYFTELQILRANKAPETKVNLKTFYKLDLATGWILEFSYQLDTYADDYHMQSRAILKEKE